MTEMSLLSRWEEVYLLAIWELEDNAYGVTIKKKVSKKTRKVLSYGSLYFALAQLVKKGLVEKSPGEPTHKRGGRRKYYYSLTKKGKRALRATYDHQKSLWEDVAEPLF
jgi:DNA-binding PadR family transcriptional regulator